jgi:hypothetical protein
MTFCNFFVVGLDGTCKEEYKNLRGGYEFGGNIEDTGKPPRSVQM